MFGEILAMAVGSAGLNGANCAWATPRDVAALRIEVGQDEAFEGTASTRQPGETENAHEFRIRVTRENRGARCMRVRWRAVPRGGNPASPADFAGNKWPRGIVLLPAWPTAENLNPPDVEILINAIDDGRPEVNETFAIELVDARDSVLWGSERWLPKIGYGTVNWNNRGREHKDGVVLTLHDAGHVCSVPDAGTGFSIVNKRAAPEERRYWAWPGIFVRRPIDRAIVQCEVVRWHVEAGGPRPLRATDFAGGAFPMGRLRFSSNATGSEDQENELPISFRLRNVEAGRGRTVVVVVDGKDGIVARSAVTLN